MSLFVFQMTNPAPRLLVPPTERWLRGMVARTLAYAVAGDVEGETRLILAMRAALPRGLYRRYLEAVAKGGAS